VPGDFSFPTRGELNVEQRFVVRNHADWQGHRLRMLPKLYDGSGRAVPSNPGPSIDFAREMILIAELGLRGSGGFGVNIIRATDRGRFIEVEVRQFSPSGRCHVVADNEVPTDVVRIPASSKPIRWRVINQVRGC